MLEGSEERFISCEFSGNFFFLQPNCFYDLAKLKLFLVLYLRKGE